jgi:hypothetical protein
MSLRVPKNFGKFLSGGATGSGLSSLKLVITPQHKKSKIKIV